jgi:hypothetical protein
MKHKQAAWVLLAIQMALVLSVAGNYWYERRTCPRVWAQAAQYDPNLPLRGRYLGLQLMVNACSLPRDKGSFFRGYNYPSGHVPGYWRWNVVVAAEGGHLVPRVADRRQTTEDSGSLILREDQPCESVPLSSTVNFYLPDTAKGPFPLAKGEALWVEVTVPPSGAPRPIGLAVSSAAGWRALKFE